MSARKVQQTQAPPPPITDNTHLMGRPRMLFPAHVLPDLQLHPFIQQMVYSDLIMVIPQSIIPADHVQQKDKTKRKVTDPIKKPQDDPELLARIWEWLSELLPECWSNETTNHPLLELPKVNVEIAVDEKLEKTVQVDPIHKTDTNGETSQLLNAEPQTTSVQQKKPIHLFILGSRDGLALNDQLTQRWINLWEKKHDQMLLVTHVLPDLSVCRRKVMLLDTRLDLKRMTWASLDDGFEKPHIPSIWAKGCANILFFPHLQRGHCPVDAFGFLKWVEEVWHPRIETFLTTNLELETYKVTECAGANIDLFRGFGYPSCQEHIEILKHISWNVSTEPESDVKYLDGHQDSRIELDITDGPVQLVLHVPKI